MKSAEFTMVCQMLSELRAEVQAIRTGVDSRIESVAKTVMEAFQGFGILDPDEDTWTDKQVRARYHVSRKTLYNYRMSGKLPYTQTGEGTNCTIRYRKADIIELFATRNAQIIHTHN
ncbi:DNA-binding protein [Muribaculaceae bacterium Isolate-042 (Harlan)]|jgi:hypothetical protein|uniref:DNA-binding protein n=2 Tax=Muribaculaceae TaxID=2005473 RepID=A0A2V1II07_9BACT|nr:MULTISPECIES: helix-turn-helix domain-containing protein [Bacteroidales]MBJ2197539.1 helix-turn-helix domain-containing protein [Muribaculaceae bacterium]ROS79355.1 DNA-binding protein [Muribaculaceae bacterium Isolate-042 (Harlan)]ROT10316.1 DNA-binding protein [Muribaculaceae bacterium Isolate-104 (HZI)]ROT17680.1 DNA-binding protein [Muribaculaceae bacterium Isolate-110 (HZI)]PWB00438.1 DNA-binding protein [Duncaniella muris]